MELHSHRLKLLILQKSPKLRNSNAAVQDDLTNVQMPPSVIKPVHHHDDHPACKSLFQAISRHTQVNFGIHYRVLPFFFKGLKLASLAHT